MYSYIAFNLIFKSEIILPELSCFSGLSHDVTIQFGKVTCPHSSQADIGFAYQVVGDEAYFTWDSIGNFLVKSGNMIVADPLPDIEERVIRLPLLGTVMGALLHQRGLLLLHGSSVAINGSAIVFLGHKGRGKSTIASKLYSRGHHFISDDHIVFDKDTNGKISVIPAYPHIKLWEDAIYSTLGKTPDELHLLHPQLDKRGYKITDRFAKETIPIKQIFVIERGDEIGMMPIDPKDAVIELIRYSYFSRFGAEFFKGKEADNFFSCIDLANHVPISKLIVPSNLSKLQDVAILIESN